MIEKFCLVPVLFFLASCAQPKYEQVTTISNDGFSIQNLEDCELRFEQSRLCLLWRWEKKPTESDVGVLVFKTVRPNKLDGSSLPQDVDGDVEVVLWMPSMGHGSTPTQTDRIDTGSFRVQEVFFVMHGEWTIYFRIMKSGQKIDEARVDLKI